MQNSGGASSYTMGFTSTRWEMVRTGAGTETSIRFDPATHFEVITGGAGSALRILDTTASDNMQLYHDGTDAFQLFFQTADFTLGTGLSGDILINDAPVFFEERASANADRAGYGQIWVKNDAPNTAWFTDDIGTDQPLVGSYYPAIESELNSPSLTLTNLELEPYVYDVRRAGIIPDSPSDATANTTALQALLDPLTNGPKGKFIFPNVSGNTTYYFDDIIPIRDGCYLDLHNCTLDFTTTYASVVHDATGFLYFVRDVIIENGTINVDYDGSSGIAAGHVIKIGNRGDGGIHFQGDEEDFPLNPYGNCTLRNLKLISNNPGGKGIVMLGGLINVLLENISIDGSDVLRTGIDYEFGYWSLGGVPGDHIYSHAQNLVFKNIYVKDLDISSDAPLTWGLGLRGAMSALVDGLVVDKAAQVLNAGSGESMYWNPDPRTVDMFPHIIYRNIHAINITGVAFQLDGATDVSGGELSGEGLTPSDETDLISYSVDGFSIDGAAVGVALSGPAHITNGKITNCTSEGIRLTDECVDFTIDNVIILDGSTAGIRGGFGDPLFATERKKVGSITNCFIAGNANNAIDLDHTQSIYAGFNRIGYTTAHDGVAETTQNVGISIGVDAQGVIADSNVIATSGGSDGYGGASGADGILINPLGSAVDSSIHWRSDNNSVGTVGDASTTLTHNTDERVQRYATTLTANRTVTLATADAVEGARFRVVRTGLGAFTLDVGGLQTIPASTAAFVDVEYDGSAWVLTGYSLLGAAGTSTNITVTDESSDTTCFPGFFTAATGDLEPKTNTGLTFNSSTSDLNSTLIAGIANANLLDKTASETISGAYTFTNAMTLNNAAPEFRIQETGATADEGNWIVIANGDIFRLSTASDAAPATAVENAIAITRTGTATTDIDLRGTGNVIVTGGAGLQVVDSFGGPDSITIDADGTDINFTGVSVTDLNISGFTAIQAGTVDADFDAITATSYGGITEANLVDKTDTETISGIWTHSDLLITDASDSSAAGFRLPHGSAPAAPQDILAGSTPTVITVADSTDTTSFPAFFESATGDLGPKTDASNYTYNATTGALTAVSFVGALTGNADTATTATNATNINVTDESADTTTFPVFVNTATGNQAPHTGSNLTFNSSTGDLSATLIAGIANANLLDKTAAETVSGSWIFTDHARFNDSDELRFGTDLDSEIHHNGTDFFLNIATGTMNLRVNSKLAIHAAVDAATTLYYNGSAKLATATDGIDVTGDVGGTTIGGITEANLLDKTDTETISGMIIHLYVLVRVKIVIYIMMVQIYY
jgi:hypothetical protein